MREPDRLARNAARLEEVNPVFRDKLVATIWDLEHEGHRPRIQIAWRSPADQMVAYSTGHSKLQWGFHNATTPDGRPDALAVDVVDDDFPLDPRRAFIVAVSHFARQHGLNTGIDWALPFNIKAAVNAAVAANVEWLGKIGWDPLHIEWVGISVADAKRGVRPAPVNPASPQARA
jgi:hypothetical protein